MGRLFARPSHTSRSGTMATRTLTLAPKTKLNLRTVFHVIYICGETSLIAILLLQFGRAVAVAPPRILTVQEIKLLLAQLGEPYHTMVLVAAFLWRRASEIMGLQWSDFDWGKRTVLIRRG